MPRTAQPTRPPKPPSPAGAAFSRFVCIRCGSTFPLAEFNTRCSCGGLLEVRHDLERLGELHDPEGWKLLFRERLLSLSGPQASGVWRYHELVLPDLPPQEVISLYEGNTGLHPMPALQRRLESGPLHLKHEGENPTLSFKDRGMTAGVSWASYLRVPAVVCASTGDTSAALAAYAARVEGMAGVVIVPRDGITPEQLAQPVASGTRTIRLDTDFDGCLRLMEELAHRHGLYVLNSLNPIRIEGQKAIAFEMLQQLGWEPPDWVVVPVGNAGNISALGKAFFELRELGLIDRVPRLAGAQVAEAAPLARAFREGRDTVEPVRAAFTRASAIRIGDPVSAPKALAVVRKSGGVVIEVEESALLDAKALVDASGVSICPNSGVAVAGWMQLVEDRTIGRKENAVVVATAHGIKFSEATLAYHLGEGPDGRGKHANPPVEAAATIEDLERALWGAGAPRSS
jgi:threonine synthase